MATLPNGMRVVIEPERKIPRVTLCLAYYVGSGDEGPGQRGYAHFIEHLMFRGTREVPDYDDVFHAIGTLADAVTTEDVTAYYQTFPSEYLETACYVEANRITGFPAALDRAKINGEREVIRSERLGTVDDAPYGIADRCMRSLLYNRRHPYHSPILGRQRDLDAACPSSVAAFFSEWYQPSNAVISIVGDVDEDSALRTVAKYFSGIATAPPAIRTTCETPRPPARRLQLGARVSASRTYLLWPTVPRVHPDAAALGVLAEILAGGDFSRLGRRFSAGHSVVSEIFAQNTAKALAGYFVAWLTSSGEQDRERDERSATTEIADLREHPPKPAELSAAQKKQLIALHSGASDIQTRAVLHATRLLTSNAPYDALLTQKLIERVGPDDLARVYDCYLSGPASVLVIKPRGTAVETGACGRPVERAEMRHIAAPTSTTPRSPSVRAASIAPARLADCFNRWPVLHGRTRGINLWTSSWENLPLTMACLRLAVGSADDPPAKAGLAAMACRLVARGAYETRNWCRGYADLGTELAGECDVDATRLRFTCLSGDFAPALELLLERCKLEGISADAVRRERELHLVRVLQSQDWIVRRLTSALLYGVDHPNGMPSDGSPEGVAAITREDICWFMSQKLRRAPRDLLIVGESSEERLAATIEEFTPSLSTELDLGPVRRAPRGPDPDVIYLLDNPGSTLSLLSVSRVWFHRAHPDFVGGLLCNLIFGGNFGSRLNQALRVRAGYCYGAGSRFESRQGSTVWSATATVPWEVTGGALAMMINEVDRMAGEAPPTDSEIEQARNAERLRIASRYQTMEGCMTLLNEAAELNRLGSGLAQLYEQLDHIPPERVRSISAAVMSRDARLHLVVGDLAHIGRSLSYHGFDTKVMGRMER